ncbi:MAG TPA: DNA strand exchange inhibitor protein [Gemmataceae bacterium]|jgi:DNA mismatch repair protein MutS2|nr:DNA strand exchange inhibitor protein [Gemmataceae bacterium]
MDAHTLELLEFDKVRRILATYASSSLGKELALQVEPTTDPSTIFIEQSRVTEMVWALELEQAPPLGGLRDVRLLARRAAIGSMLTADELLDVAATLGATGDIYRYRTRLSERCQRLIAFLTPIEDLGMMAKTITGCIDSRGHVLDMASPELARVRQQLAEVDERVQNQIKRLLRDPELRRILRFPNATVSGDHYVLPVAVNHRHKLQGVVHRTSSTGETVYIEPAGVAHLSAERAVVKGEEDKEIRRILRGLSADVGRVARPLCFAIDLMAHLDLITAKARMSRAFAMNPPALNADGKLWLRQARHPLLEHLFRTEDRGSKIEDGESSSSSNLAQSREGAKVFGDLASLREISDPPSSNPHRTVVPIDIHLGVSYNLLVITGPNTGGKTVSLKTAGLLCLMAQTGMHIPASEGSTVPVFHEILADIGDEQSLEQSLSTFSSHMSRIGTILGLADKESLVLLDELGAGTDPTEGAALGRAILDELDRIGCRAMVTTHLGDLKTYAFSNQHAENAAVEFNVETLRPSYHLRIGQFGMSNALKIARRLKLPRNLVKRAHRYLRRRQRRSGGLAQLQQAREQTEKAREEALHARHEADRQRDEYLAKIAQLQKEANEAAALREARQRLQLNDPVRVARFDKEGRIVRVDLKRQIALVSVGLGQWEVPLEEVFPSDVK